MCWCVYLYPSLCVFSRAVDLSKYPLISNCVDIRICWSISFTLFISRFFYLDSHYSICCCVTMMLYLYLSFTPFLCWYISLPFSFSVFYSTSLSLSVFPLICCWVALHPSTKCSVLLHIASYYFPCWFLYLVLCVSLNVWFKIIQYVALQLHWCVSPLPPIFKLDCFFPIYKVVCLYHILG